MGRFLHNLWIYLKFIKYNSPKKPRQILKLFKKSQYWDRNELEIYQLNLLNDLLYKAVNNSIYYKKKFKDISLPLSNIEEFNQIPCIQKQDIQANNDDIRIKSNSKTFKHTTSGSTGDPLSVYIPGLAAAIRRANLWRFLGWWSIKPHDKNVLIWGMKEKDKKLLNRIKNRYMKNLFNINVFNLNSKTIIEYFNAIEKFKPKYIRGYKSGILQFSELLIEKGIKFHSFKFNVAIVTAEILLDTEKDYIENALNCKVANEYGSAETGLIAYECPEGSMHVCEEFVYINTDSIDNIYVTELYNDSMPLFNYKLGDKVHITNELCSCGRTSRIISKVEGRVDDYVLCPNRTKLSQYIFYYIIKELDDIGYKNSILRYKIVQNKNNFVLFIVPSKDYSSKVEDYIKDRMYEEIGQKININIKLVQSIQREKSGKLRFFIREK